MRLPLLALLLIGVLLLSGCVEFPEETSIDKTTTESSSTNEEIVKDEVKEVTYSMNENAPVDYLTYTITKAESLTEVGNSVYNEKTDGKFIKIYLTILNNGKETKNMFSPRFKIQDDKGRTYDQLTDDFMYVENYIGFGEALQPGLSVNGELLFELPTDSQNLKLIISGDWLSTKQIAITLNNIEVVTKENKEEEYNKNKQELGERFHRGNFQVEVKSFGFYTAEDMFGESEEFFRVDFYVENIGESDYFSPSGLSIVDGNGNQYEPSFTGGTLDAFKNMHTKTKQEGYVLFEGVPKDLNVAKLMFELGYSESSWEPYVWVYKLI